MSKSEKVKVKCYYRKDIRVISIKPNCGYKNLLRKVREEYNRTVDMYWEDDGDNIKITSDRQLSSAIKLCKDSTLKLTLKRKSKSGKSRDAPEPKQDFSVLEHLVDACVVIASDGYIIFFNTAASRLFGYSPDEVVGRNVRVLMTDMYAARHDSYLENYLRTGRAKIIGTTRSVLGRHKSGRAIGIDLSLSETKVGNKTTFTGIIKESVERSGSNRGASGSDTFSLLDGLLEAVICIDDGGIVLHANPKALSFFGYTATDLIGQNVNMLMPSPHSDNHNRYMAEYLNTGHTTVIGKTRETICELSDGSICPILLSVSETIVNGKKQFVGTISRRATAGTRKVSLLVQQRQVIETLATPAIIIDSNCSVQAFNQSALRLLRYNLDDVLGQNVSMIVGGGHAASHDTYVQNYLNTGVTKVIGKDRKLYARSKIGKEIEIILSVTEHKDADKVFFTGMFFHAAK